MDDQLETFRSDGFVVIRGFLDSAEVDTYLQHGLAAAQLASQDFPGDVPDAWRLTMKGVAQALQLVQPHGAGGRAYRLAQEPSRR